MQRREEKVLHGGRREVKKANGGEEANDVNTIKQNEEISVMVQKEKGNNLAAL